MNQVQQLCSELADKLGSVIDHIEAISPVYDGRALSRHRMIENVGALDRVLRRLRSDCELLAGDGDVFDRLAMYTPVPKYSRLQVDLVENGTTAPYDSLVHVPNITSEVSHA